MDNEKFEILTQILEINNSEEYDAETIEPLKQRIYALDDDDLKVSLAQLYYKWSESLISEDNAEEKFKKALQTIEEATIIHPANDKHFYNWGVVLGEYQKFRRKGGNENLYYQAIKKYEKATKLNEQFTSSFYNWGSDLIKLALTLPQDLAIEKINEAIPLLEKAFFIQPNRSKPLHNIALAYHYLAEYDLENQLMWLEKAQSYYDLIADFFHEKGIIDKQGITSKDIGVTKKGKEREEQFSKAILHHLTAIQKGEEVYNLACTYAAMGDEKNAFLFLEKSLEFEEVSKEDVLSDPDWQKHLQNDDFKNMINDAFL